ncbi:hypothetical protein LAZ67_2003680 [Cordylochernes scorpioides]|uniref:Uncharacterized protein n=1 Tax=Cordylochernes scorpioides TaxID=51811 RepID=A0ABY6K478_9ARAC|nr:hypothetical protein LAZ67_2003680 [Cordylochernes scorpioides]
MHRTQKLVLGKISVDFPWTTLYTDPTLVHVEDILIVAAPISDLDYTPDLERRLSRAAKDLLLADLQETLPDEELGETVFCEGETVFCEGEAVFCGVDTVFCGNCRLQRLPSVEIAACRDCRLQRLPPAEIAVCRNCRLQRLPPAENRRLRRWERHLQRGKRLVKPVSAKVKMIFNKTMEEKVPKLLLDFVLQDAAAQFSKEQYVSLYRIADSFKRLEVGRQFVHYKIAGEAETAKSRWHFAYRSVLEEYVRPHSWDRILQHRKKYGRYVETYKQFLIHPEEEELREKVLELEDTLDVVNILLAREQAKLEMLQQGPDQVQRKPVQKSWWQSWWDGGPEEPVLVENHSRSVWTRLTPEERERLRELYHPPPPGSPAPEAIGHKLNFTLANFTFSLLRCPSDRSAAPGEILVVTLTQFLTSLETRPEAKAFKLSARTESFVVEGAASDTDLVPIMTADNLISGNNLSHVFALDLEKNPLFVEAGFGLTVKAEPMEVVYHELPSLKFQELKNMAVGQLKSAAQIGRSALEYALTTRQTIHLSVNLKSPYVVIPEHGSLLKSGKVLVFQCVCCAGDEWRNCRLKGQSDLHIMPKIRIKLLFSNSINPEYKQLPKQKLNLSIPTLKLNFSDRRVRQLVEFVHNVPLPRTLGSDSPDGVSLPNYPPLDPQHMLQPVTAPLLRQMRHQLYLRHGLNLLASRSASQTSLHGSDQDFNELTSAEQSSDEEREEDWAWRVDLPGLEDNVSPNNRLLRLARIQLGDVEVHLQRSAGDRADRPYLLLRLEQACADLAWLEHGPALQASLGALTLVDKLHPGPSGEYLELISTQGQSDMFTILYRKVQASCPDFKSHFHQVEHSLVMDLSVAMVMFHREAFRTLARFLQYLFSRVQQPSKASPFSLDLKTGGPFFGDPEHDPPVPHGATKFSISARVGQIQARLCDTELDLAMLHVAGLECDYVLKANERMILRLNLNEVSIEDLMDTTLYTKILTIEDDKVFEFKYIHFSPVPITKEQIEPQDSDPVRMDGSLRLKIGRLQLVFLHKFFLELQRFFEPFILPKVSQMAKKSATALVNQKVWEFKEQGLKLKLHVDIAAPSILLPQKSSSANLLILSLGDLSLENFFSPPTVDNILLRLDHLHMARTVRKCLNRHPERCCRALILLDGTTQTQEAILEPMKLRLDIKRTVPPLVGRDVLYDISGSMDVIQINIGQRDLATILAVVRENFSEGRLAEIHKPEEARTPTTSASGAADPVRKLEAFLSVTTEVTVKAQVNFILEGLVVTLYTDPDEVVSGLEFWNHFYFYFLPSGFMDPYILYCGVLNTYAHPSLLYCSEVFVNI